MVPPLGPKRLAGDGGVQLGVGNKRFAQFGGGLQPISAFGQDGAAAADLVDVGGVYTGWGDASLSQGSGGFHQAAAYADDHHVACAEVLY